MNIVEVKFDGNNQTEFFRNSNIIEDNKKIEDVVEYNVVRISTKKDYLQHLKNLKAAEEAIIKCRDIVNDYDLAMNIIDASYNFDGSQLLFRFVADERIDFRDLVRDLGSTFKTRIELRQVGIRDRAKEIGGIGPCGRTLCCASFLNSFDSVTINMAKNQNVSLNPTKINGVCGRLLCCLKYENDVYSEYKKKIPKLNSKVDYNGETAKVVAVDILKSKYKLELNDKSIVEIELDDEGKE